MFNIQAKKQYDLFFIWDCLLHCNFHCHYCINNPRMNIDDALLLESDIFLRDRNNGPVPTINIAALLDTLDKTKKTALFQLTGGEPLLIPNIVEVFQKLTQKHYIIINTNLSMPKMQSILQASDREHIFFVVASFHVLELERLGLIDVFMENCKLLIANNIQVNLMGVGHPESIAKLLEYKKKFLDLGLFMNIEPFRGYYQGKKYPLEYSTAERKAYEIDSNMGDSFFLNQNQQCNAGYNIAYVEHNGDICSCANKRNEKMGNIYTGFELKKTLQSCSVDFCGCPFKNYDKDLFEKARLETLSNNA